MKNLALKFPTSSIQLMYLYLTNYSNYVAFDEALALLDHLRKYKKQKLENEQHSRSNFSERALKITVSKTYRGIFRTQPDIYDGAFL